MTFLGSFQKFFITAMPWLFISAVGLLGLCLVLRRSVAEFIAEGLGRFNALTILNKLVAMAVVCLCVWRGGSKENGPLGLTGTTGVPPVDVAKERAILGDASTGGTRSGASAPYFTDISTTPTSVWLSAAWPEGFAVPGGLLGLYASPAIESNLWTYVGSLGVSPAETNVSVEIQSAVLPDGSGSREFFMLASSRDSDNDGLTDAEEAERGLDM